jgi:hypothetical protein
MLGSLSGRHLGIPCPERGIKSSQVTKLSRTTSELVETKTQTDYEVHRYLASTAAVQTSLDEETTAKDSQVPQANPASHIRVKRSHFEEAIFETAVWDGDYTSLAEHIIDDVEFETYLDEYASASEYDDDPKHCLAQLFNLIIDLALRRVSKNYEPAIRMRVVSQALPVGPIHSTHPVCFATAQRDHPEAARGWPNAIFLLEIRTDPRNTSALDAQMLSSSPITGSSIPFPRGTAETATGYAPEASKNSGSTGRHREDETPKCTKRALSNECGPIGTEPRRKRRRVGETQSPAGKETPETLSKSGIHHPKNAPTSGMAACALEMFSALGNRRHLLGISVAGLQGRFWYFDRAGTVSTEEINISDLSFVATLLRMLFATPYHLGFEHSFEAPLEDLPHTESGNIVRQAQTWPHFNDIKGYRIVFMGHTFILNHVLHSSRCLYGRGTAVYMARAHPTASNSDPGTPNLKARPMPDTVVLKLSWSTVRESNEGELLELANEAGVEGIPELWTARHIRRLSSGARGRLSDSSQYEDRELRVQVMTPLCIPLHRVSNAFELKHAFISLVKSEWPSPK